MQGDNVHSFIHVHFSSYLLGLFIIDICHSFGCLHLRKSLTYVVKRKAMHLPGRWGICTWPKGGWLDVSPEILKLKKWIQINKENFFWKSWRVGNIHFHAWQGQQWEGKNPGGGANSASDTIFRCQIAQWWLQEAMPTQDWHFLTWCWLWFWLHCFPFLVPSISIFPRNSLNDLKCNKYFSFLFKSARVCVYCL